MPGIGTLLNLFGQLVKLPGKALSAAGKSIKTLPSKLQAAANEKVEGGLEEAFDGSGRISSLKSLLGNSGNTKTEARKLWQTINRGFIQPVTSKLPHFKYANADNLIKKPFKSLVQEAAKDRLERKKEKRETKHIVEHNNKQHQELKEKWKIARQQRNNTIDFNDNINRDFSQQYANDMRSLQDYYNVLLDQNASDKDKTEAEYKLEREKLETKYEQLNILQESLASIQKNFGKLAIVNENNFDVIQEQIANSADLSDTKQSDYNENIVSDIQYLQETNDNNAEVIVDAITEGQELQTETLNQLNSNIVEQNLQQDKNLEEALQTIEQQQKERHIQQMYVLNNMGAELVAAEQQRNAQSSEQAYIYNKFMKKQKEFKLSIPNMLIGGIFGVLNSFLKALANPEQVVDALATTVGSFAAEMLSLIQFIVGNSMYGLGHLFAKFASPINSFLAKIFPPDFARSLMIDKDLVKNMVSTAQYLPKQFSSLGMPDMLVMPPPEIVGIKDDSITNNMAAGLWNLQNNFVDTVKALPDKIKADWEAAEGISGVAQFIGSYAAPALMLPLAAMMPPLIPVALGTLGAKTLTLAGGISREYDAKEGKWVSKVDKVEKYGDVPEIDTKVLSNSKDKNINTKVLPQAQRTKAQTNNVKIQTPKIELEPIIDKNQVLEQSLQTQSANSQETDDVDSLEAEKAPIHIDNSTNNYNTFITQQQDKQIAAGV